MRPIPIGGQWSPVRRAVLGQQGYLLNPNPGIPNRDLSAQLDRHRFTKCTWLTMTSFPLFLLVVDICRAFVPCLLGGDVRDPRFSTISSVFLCLLLLRDAQWLISLHVEVSFERTDCTWDLKQFFDSESFKELRE